MPSRESYVIFLKSSSNLLDVPEFVKQNERLLKTWEEKWEQIVTHSFDLADVIRYIIILNFKSLLVPDNSANFESQLDKVLKEQRAHDIYELIQQCKRLLEMN